MTKIEKDFELGRERRETAAKYLNNFLKNHGVILRPIHDCLKLMKIHEKVANATTKNMLQPAAFESAMGLDYMLTSNNRIISDIRFAILIKNSQGIYRKIPKEYKDDVSGYLKLLQAYNYYFLLVNIEKMTFSHPISIETAIKYWSYTLCQSKGNTNRLQFHGPVSTIDTIDPNLPTFEGSVIENIIKLRK